MLCRTASDLYWLSRHIERMDNTARIIDLAHRIAMLPERHGSPRDDARPWTRALEALGLEAAFAKRVGAVPTRDAVLEFLICDHENPSSVVACVRAARESGRAQRSAITADMYEDLNTSWLRVRDLDGDAIAQQGLTPFLEWLKRRSASFRGVTVGTMGRDDSYEFLRLGTFVERADFGVRMLDVNFSERRRDPDAGAGEYYEMSALLQALSAFETFRKVYRDAVTAERVAELVILRSDMPRSLAICTAAIQDVLSGLLPSRHVEAARLAGVLAAKTRYGRIDEIFGAGMHAYLALFLEQLYRLADEINREFMMPTDVIAA